MFNALRYIKKLEAVGFAREQAEAQVQLVLETIDEEVATKGDIAEVRSEISKLRGEFAELRVEFAEFKVDVIVKLGATIIGSVTIATAVIGLLIKL